ncbi:MAG: hypothetical protein L6R48_10050 [Planctomycetes bacterium]|nr:hypothetical protein [Planctomycetota bacterium]
MTTRLVPALVALACAAGLQAADPSGLRQEANLLIDGDEQAVTYAEVAVAGGRWLPASWRGEERARRTIQALVPVPANRWGQATLRFTPQRSGTVRLVLSGRNRAGKDDPTPPAASAVVWDAVEIVGATLADGGFEQGEGVLPAGWTTDKPAGVQRVRDPLLVREGAAAVQVADGVWLQQAIQVEAGVTVAVTVHAFRPVGPQSRALDLSAAADRGLRDENPGDGKGGWTDQGKANDLRTLPAGEHPFADVRFRIGEGERAAIVLRGSQRPALPERATLPLPAGGRPARFLYLLHAGAWARSLSGEIGRIVPVRADGGDAPAIPVLGGRDVGDWWSPASLANARVAWTAENGSAYVGLYVSRFALPDAPLSALRFESANAAVWGIVGASLSEAEVPLPEIQAVTMAADEVWRPYAHQRDILAGSALDLSGLLDAPAGRHGAVAVREDRLVFADGTRARFAGNNLSVMWPELLAVPDAELERLADRFARLGINLVRVSHLDAVIRSDAGGAPALVPEQIERFDRLVAEFKRRGIYITIELFMGRWSQAITKRRFPEQVAKGTHERHLYETAFMVDPEFRADLKAWATVLLGHVNPHTGMAYAREPALAFVGMTNEDPAPHLVTALLEGRYGGMPPVLGRAYAAAFAAWLKGVHGDQVALAAAWGDALAAGEGLAEGVAVRPGAGGRRGEDTLRFLVDAQGAAWADLEAHVRGLGLTVPFTDCNMTNSRFAALLRTRFPLVDNHSYFDHPKFLVKDWQLPYGFHQRALVRPGRWWSRENHALEMAVSRHAGRPFAVSEYDHVFPNRHRNESGVVFGAIAALQDWDALMQFTYNAEPKPLWAAEGAAKPFAKVDDPIGLATELQLRFLFLRGDLRPAPGMVELFARPGELAASEWTLGDEAALLAFVTRTGLRLAEAPTPDATTLPIHTRAEGGAGMLPRAKGIEPTDLAAWFAQVKERVLPPGNRSDPANGVMESATGEVLWRFAQGQVLVDTPRSCAVVVKAKAAVTAGALSAEIDAGAASLSVHSLDAQPIAASRRLLAVLATDLLNQGMRLEDDGRVVVTWGQAQKLLRSGRAAVSLRCAAPLKAWVLDGSGKRLAEVPTTFTDGVLGLTLDQRATPALYWELAAE